MHYVGMPTNQIEAMRQTPAWPQLESIAPTLAYDAAILGEDSSIPTERIAVVTAPTLVMNGGASFPFMYVTAQALSKTIPHAKLRIYRRSDSRCRRRHSGAGISGVFFLRGCCSLNRLSDMPLLSNKVSFLDYISRIANKRNINHFPLVCHSSQTLFLCLFVKCIKLSRPGNIVVRGCKDAIC